MTTAASTSAFSAAPVPPLSPNVISLRNASARTIVPELSYGWRDDVIQRLNELVRLPRGWDGYHGGPVAFSNAHFALRMLEAVCGMGSPAPQIVPGADGDLQIEWHTDSAVIELHVLGPNHVHAWRQLSDGSDPEELSLGNDFTTVARWISRLSELPIAAGAAAA
ncbi:MAG: hypothetical protein KIT85_07705 [Pseudolabrys sp.]|nr:hypothetical protein [Pseudolabrys sp.]